MTTAIHASRDLLEPATFRPFPLEEYEARWVRVHEAMKAKEKISGLKTEKAAQQAADLWDKTP